MSQAPIMPLATDALIGDTMGLSTEEFGAYMLILVATWRNNGKPLRNDDILLSRVTRISLSRFKAKIKPTLLQFFDLSDGYLHQKRLEREWVRVQILRESRSNNGKLGGRPKTLKNNETIKAKAKANGKLNESTHTHILIENPNGFSCESSSTGPPTGDRHSAVEAEFEEFYRRYPKRQGRGHALKAFKAARKLASLEVILAGIDCYVRDHPGINSQYIPLPASWLNGRRWLDEPDKSADRAFTYGIG